MFKNFFSILTYAGYTASNIQYTGNGITADLTLARPTCDAYGDDLKDLRLAVDYETGVYDCEKAFVLKVFLMELMFSRVTSSLENL
jgi:hypothetical protein